MMPVRTTHAGSLPRTGDVMECLLARERGEVDDPVRFGDVMRHAVDEAVRRQIEAGIDIVSDGDLAKTSYATHLRERYDGFAGGDPPGGSGTRAAQASCVGEIRLKGRDALVQELANLRIAMDRHEARRGFMTAASPGIVALSLPNAHYRTQEAYLFALADAMKAEYETIVAAGLKVQVDCPVLVMGCHAGLADLSDRELVRLAEVHVEVLNHALANVPRNRVRIRVCWGGDGGPHVCDVILERVFRLLMEIDAKYVLFEAADPRHAGKWTLFRDGAREIPDDWVLVPGVIDMTSDVVEPPELIRERLQRFVEIVGAERVIGGSDGAFDRDAGQGRIAPEIAWAKLAALARGAALVR